MKTNLFKFFKKENNDVKDSEILLEKKKYDYDKNNLKGVLVDTNFLLNNTKDLENIENPFFSSYVLREIEHLELTRKQDKNLQAQIRGAKRYLETVESKYIDINDYKYDLDENLDGEYVDNLLVQIALANNLSVATNDRLLKEKCKAFGIVLEDVAVAEEDYKGFKEISVSEAEYYSIYNNLDINSHDLLENEYLIVRDEDIKDNNKNLFDIFVWKGTHLESIRNSKNGKYVDKVSSYHFGDVFAQDAYQLIGIHSIRTNDVTQIRGSAGSGKTLVALSSLWSHVEETQGTLYIIANNIEVKGSAGFGLVKGSLLEKLEQSSIFNILSAKFGDTHILLDKIQDGSIKIIPLSQLRGVSIPSGSAIFLTEAQNYESYGLRLILQRAEENVKIVVEGDSNQVDIPASVANGLSEMSQALRGEDLYGEVVFEQTHRSRLTKLADRMKD